MGEGRTKGGERRERRGGERGERTRMVERRIHFTSTISSSATTVSLRSSWHLKTMPPWPENRDGLGKSQVYENCLSLLPYTLRAFSRAPREFCMSTIDWLPLPSG